MKKEKEENHKITKVKKKNKKGKQVEIELLRIKPIANKTEKESKSVFFGMGMLVEAGLIAALAAFCIFCFITGMHLPVRKLGLSIEILVISILFWFTFSINKGSGYIFSGELLLYAIFSFKYRNEISHGLAAIINHISQKVMMYYKISLPLFQEVKHPEKYMSIFLMFFTIVIIGITAYVVVNKSARFFLCLVQFPIALGALLVGYLPGQLYFIGYVIAVTVLLSMPKQNNMLDVSGKKILQQMTIKTTILAISIFVLLYGMVWIGMPKKSYDKMEVAAIKEQLQDKMEQGFLGKITGFGKGVAVGGLSHGQLGQVDVLRYTGKKCLKVTLPKDVQYPVYLKSYVGEKYENDHWESFIQLLQVQAKSALDQMENGEEQGVAWIQMFQDMDEWFSEEAFDKYSGSCDGDIVGLSSMLSDSSFLIASESNDISYIKDDGSGYSYNDVRAILNEGSEVITVKNIGVPTSENYVPYGRIIKKDQDRDGLKIYAGYPNLNLYVKGGLNGYGYENGNFIKGLTERCKESSLFINICLSCFDQNERDELSNSEITLEELIDKVEKKDGMVQEDGEIEKGEKVNIVDEGYYQLFTTYSTRYILYLKSELSLKNALNYLSKIDKYENSSKEYEAFVKDYQGGERYNSKLWDICMDFKDEKMYTDVIDSENADLRLAYIGDCVSYVTDYLAKHMEYSLAPGKLPEGEKFIEYYLYQQKKGYCSHFATIATTMFRMLGVPARYVEGFVVRQSDLPKLELESQIAEQKDQTVELKDNSAHAWVEIYIEGYGWIPIEVTPGYENGVEQGDLQKLVDELSEKKRGEDKQNNTAPTTVPSQNSMQQKNLKQNYKNSVLYKNLVNLVKIIIVLLFLLGVAILVIWIRFVYTWKQRIISHANKKENARVCNYYARMEQLLKGVGLLQTTDSLRDCLILYVQGKNIKEKNIVFFIEAAAGHKQWEEFLGVLDIAAYSSQEVLGNELEIVRCLEENLRKEVFASMSKIKIIYFQYIRLL